MISNRKTLIHRRCFSGVCTLECHLTGECHIHPHSHHQPPKSWEANEDFPSYCLCQSPSVSIQTNSLTFPAPWIRSLCSATAHSCAEFILELPLPLSTLAFKLFLSIYMSPTLHCPCPLPMLSCVQPPVSRKLIPFCFKNDRVPHIFLSHRLSSEH